VSKFKGVSIDAVFGLMERQVGGTIVREARCEHLARHCERSEAIQNLSAEGLGIASLRSQ